MSIIMDNNDFYDETIDEWARRRTVARILRQLAKDLVCESGEDFSPGDCGKLSDANGNSVGDWSIHG